MKSLEKFLEMTGRMDNRVCMFYVADRLDDIINGEDPKKFRIVKKKFLTNAQSACHKQVTIN